MKKIVLFAFLSVIMCQDMRAQSWVLLKSDKYSIGMLAPSGAQYVNKDYGNSWAGCFINSTPVSINILSKLNQFITLADMESKLALLTGIQAGLWTQTESAKQISGWTWYNAFQVSNSAKTNIIIAILGQGTKGSYIVVFQTTAQDYTKNSATYLKWYSSVTLY